MDNPFKMYTKSAKRIYTNTASDSFFKSGQDLTVVLFLFYHAGSHWRASVLLCSLGSDVGETIDVQVGCSTVEAMGAGTIDVTDSGSGLETYLLAGAPRMDLTVNSTDALGSDDK